MLEVRQTQYGGRAYFATKDIPVGTTVLLEASPAVVTVYDEFKKEVCVTCFAYRNGSNLKVLVGLTSRACSEACKEAFLASPNAHEIQALWDAVQRQKPRHKKEVGEDEVNYDLLRFCVAGYVLRRRASDEFASKILALQDDYAATAAIERRSASGVVMALANLLPGEASSDLVELVDALLGRSKCNCFGIWEQEGDASFPDSEMFGYALYPESSYFNHACRPNVSKLRVGRSMRFTAERQIRGGEEMTISYLGDRRYKDVMERRAALREWGFDCQCAYCHEELAAMESDTVATPHSSSAS